MKHRLAKLGIAIPEILLPGPEVALDKWAVVACDQYTSQPDYWGQVARFTGDSPSTLQLIFPEIYLGKDDEAARIHRIQQNMLEYLEKGVLKPQEPGFIYVERETDTGVRHGLVVALDLEYYDYMPGSSSLIRATEGTVLERIPPRVRIREDAAVEVPHVMVLIDDPDCRVIEPLANNKPKLTKVYQTGLMMNGGKVTGYLVNDRGSLDSIVNGLTALTEPAHFARKYGADGRPLLLFAVGDGNHSLATAKVVWEKVKAELKDAPAAAGLDNILDHPARHALVELVNVHDPALVFEPIHRVLFNIEGDKFWQSIQTYFQSRNSAVSVEYFPDFKTMNDNMPGLRRQNSNDQRIGFVNEDKFGVIIIKQPRHNLAVGSLQAFLDDFIKESPALKIDYIHGDSTVTELGSKPGNMGFYLPPMDKADLFKTVILDGVLPRKTFSMGEADDKRFYMECRRII
jgi:hypothetical protein